MKNTDTMIINDAPLFFFAQLSFFLLLLYAGLLLLIFLLLVSPYFNAAFLIVVGTFSISFGILMLLLSIKVAIELSKNKVWRIPILGNLTEKKIRR